MVVLRFLSLPLLIVYFTYAGEIVGLVGMHSMCLVKRLHDKLSMFLVVCECDLIGGFNFYAML